MVEEKERDVCILIQCLRAVARSKCVFIFRSINSRDIELVNDHDVVVALRLPLACDDVEAFGCSRTFQHHLVLLSLFK